MQSSGCGGVRFGFARELPVDGASTSGSCVLHSAFCILRGGETRSLPCVLPPLAPRRTRARTPRTGVRLEFCCLLLARRIVAGGDSERAAPGLQYSSALAEASAAARACRAPEVAARAANLPIVRYSGQIARSYPGGSPPAPFTSSVRKFAGFGLCTRRRCPNAALHPVGCCWQKTLALVPAARHKCHPPVSKPANPGGVNPAGFMISRAGGATLFAPCCISSASLELEAVHS
jgi:hypothetical protein